MSQIGLSWRVLHAGGVTAIGLIAGTALAHVLEMPHKLAMDGVTWLSVQQVLYNGWGQKLAILDALAAVSLGLVAWHFARARSLIIGALGLVALADIAVFMVWVRPTNAALDAWQSTQPMAGWEQLRAAWEYGHALRAVLLAAATAVAAFAGTRLTSILDPQDSEHRK